MIYLKIIFYLILGCCFLFAITPLVAVFILLGFTFEFVMVAWRYGFKTGTEMVGEFLCDVENLGDK